VDKIPVLPRLTRRRIRKIVGDPLTKTNSTVRRDSIRSVVWQQLQQQPHRHSTAYGRTAIDVANPNAAVSNPNTAVANPNATGYCTSRTHGAIMIGVADSQHRILSRLLEITAPGQDDLVEFIEAYFDESGSHNESPVLCVAGYVFETKQCMSFDLKWKGILAKYRLPYFHMVDCVHGLHPFNSLSPDHRIDCEKELIAIIREHMVFGSALTVGTLHYKSIGYDDHTGTAYSWLCWMSLIAVRAWADQNKFDGKIAYFFESGHANQREANQLMNDIFAVPYLRDQYRYVSHSFVDKRQNRPIQAADMLAWLFATQYKRKKRGLNNFRKDLRALVENNDHRLMHLTPPPIEELEEFNATLMRPPGNLSGNFGRWRF